MYEKVGYGGSRMNLTVLKAVPEDAGEIIEYLKTVGGESDNLLFGEEGLPISIEQEEELIRRVNGGEKSAMLLAKTDSEIVGVCQMTGFNRERIAHRGEIAISVKKAYWGRGVGSRMMEALLSFAKEIGLDVVSLEVRSDNLKAISLYKKYGFESFGTFKKFFKINGRYYDAEFMNRYM